MSLFLQYFIIFIMSLFQEGFDMILFKYKNVFLFSYFFFAFFHRLQFKQAGPIRSIYSCVSLASKKNR